MEEVKFYVRCYDKIELARMYFPNLSNPVSVAKLRRWMRNCMPLMEELMAGDFHPKMKMFSAREVRLIVRYLGEPDGYVFLPDHADVNGLPCATNTPASFLNKERSF